MEELISRVVRALPMPTILEVPHEDKIMRMAYPESHCFINPRIYLDGYLTPKQLKGQKVYLNDNGKIARKRLRLSSPQELISLLYAANIEGAVKRNKEFRDFRYRWGQRYFFNNMTLWMPEGVYMIAGPKDDSMLELCYQEHGFSSQKLLELLRGDKKIDEVNGVLITSNKQIAFAPMGTYRTGEHDVNSFARDGLVIALARGTEYATKLAKTIEIAQKAMPKKRKQKILIADNPEPKSKWSIGDFWRFKQSFLYCDYPELILGIENYEDNRMGTLSPAVICD